MDRVLLVVSAVLVALLAFALGRPWLYAAAGVPLAIGLGVTAWRLWAGRVRRSPDAEKKPGAETKSGPEAAGEKGVRESLRDLGIMEVRQQGRSEGGGDGSDDRPAERARASEAAPRGEARDPARPRRRDASDGDAAAAREPAAGRSNSDRPGSDRPGSDRPGSDRPGSDRPGSDRGEAGAARAGPENASSEAPPPEGEGRDGEPSAPPEGPERGTAAGDRDGPAGAAAGEGAGRETQGGNRPTTTDPARAPVLAPFVQSLRAALDARTACYLVQEDVVPAYRICAIASADPEVRTAGTFETAGPLLTATMSNQPVTIRGLEGEKAVSDYLGYYTSSPAIDHVALAPVRRPDDPHTHFLLVDAAPGTDLGTRAARDLLKSYADTLRFLLDGRTGAGGDANGRPVEDLFAGGDTTSASEAAAAEAAEAAADRPAPPSDPSEPDEQQGPRPRREIIQEEMQAADAEGAPLALALVHLNRAEAIARDGEAAVASTEKLLRARLEENAPGFRVARFGELTYGVFVREGVDEVEAWAADLQDTFDRASGRLEGGVSIGVAVRTVHNDGPEELRADATEALRQAYQTGTCTIVE